MSLKFVLPPSYLEKFSEKQLQTVYLEVKQRINSEV